MRKEMRGGGGRGRGGRKKLEGRGGGMKRKRRGGQERMKGRWREGRLRSKTCIIHVPSAHASLSSSCPNRPRVCSSNSPLCQPGPGSVS